jgi:cytidylate kinase
VVFPDADVKIFLDARPDVRAERRVKQVDAVSDPARVQQVMEQMKQRDARDSGRKESPLVAAEDAIIIDSSYLGIDAVIHRIEEIIDRKLQAAAKASQ